MNTRFIVLGIMVIFAGLVLSGCTSQDGTSELSAARDLTGKWTGTPVFMDRANTCSYQGTMELTLQQTGNDVTGYYDLLVTKTGEGASCVRVGSSFRYLIQGTVSSSSISLVVADTDSLTGSFTTDLMTLRWEQCLSCDSGPAMKLVGMVSLRRE